MTDEELKGLFEGLRQDTTAIREETRALRQDNVSIRGEIAELRHDTVAIRGEITELRQDNVAIRGEIAGLRQDTDGIREEMRRENAAIRQEAALAHAETRRHFDVALNGLRDEIRLVAEGVVQTREDLARTAADHPERLERGLAETPLESSPH